MIKSQERSLPGGLRERSDIFQLWPQIWLFLILQYYFEDFHPVIITFQGKFLPLVAELDLRQAFEKVPYFRRQFSQPPVIRLTWS